MNMDNDDDINCDDYAKYIKNPNIRDKKISLSSCNSLICNLAKHNKVDELIHIVNIHISIKEENYNCFVLSLIRTLIQQLIIYEQFAVIHYIIKNINRFTQEQQEKICELLGRYDGAVFAEYLQKMYVNQETWAQYVRSFTYYSYNERLNNDEIIIELLKTLDPQNLRRVSLPFCSVNIIKYVEQKCTINYDNYNQIILYNSDNNTKLYALQQIQQRYPFLKKQYTQSNLCKNDIEFILDLIDIASNVYVDNIQINRETFHVISKLQYAYQGRLNYKFIISYTLNQLMFDIKDYDINIITPIIVDYLLKT